MIIRKLKKTDMKEVTSIAKDLPKWFTPKGIKQIQRACKIQDGFVAVDKNKTIGFATYRKWKRTAHLTWIGVLPSHHRKGTGKTLLHKIENDLRSRKIEVLKVSTVAPTVKYEPYAKTRLFYKKTGFKEHRIDKEFYKDGKYKIDRIVFLKRIS